MDCSTVIDSNSNEGCPLVCKAVTDAELKTTEDSVEVTLSDIWANTDYNIARECPTKINGVRCVPMKKEDITKKYGSLGTGGFFKAPYNQTCESRPEIGRRSITYFPPGAAGKNQEESDRFFNCLADKGLSSYVCQMVNYNAVNHPDPGPGPKPGPDSPSPDPGPDSPSPDPGPDSPSPDPGPPTSSSGGNIRWILPILVFVALAVMVIVIYRFG
jgi:hypothetical protein